MPHIVVIGLSGESVFLNVDRFNKKGETVIANDLHIEPGGKGYNQAIALGKLEADVSFITVLGNDNYKEECIRVLKENNVKPFIIEKNIHSSYAVITVDKKGENNVIVYQGATSLVTFDDIMKYKNELDKADYVLLQMEYPANVTKQLIDYLYENNKYIIVNPAPKNYLDYETLNKINILTPNEYELSLLDVDKLNNITIVVTMGNKGSRVVGIDKLYPAYKVNAIDTTGAGDTFNGGLVFSISNGNTLDEAIDFANACSALKVTKKGVIESIPTLKDVNMFMKGNKS